MNNVLEEIKTSIDQADDKTDTAASATDDLADGQPSPESELSENQVVADQPDLPATPTEDPAPTLGSSRRMLGQAQRQSGERSWYVIHTYSGYEDQVADSLKQRIESFGMHDKVFDVIVPKEKQIEIKAGKRKVVEKRIFPGYVLVDMIVDDDSWFVVRNTPNVTGFIGFGVRPTPMKQEELERIKKRMGVEEPKYKIELKIDDLVRLSDGPLKGFEGKVTDIDEDKGRVKVLISMFGRETPVTLDYLQVKKV